MIFVKKIIISNEFHNEISKINIIITYKKERGISSSPFKRPISSSYYIFKIVSSISRETVFKKVF